MARLSLLLPGLLAVWLLWPGAAAATPPAKVTLPAGKIRGTVVLAHGGAWSRTDPQRLESTDATAARLRTLGLRTVQIAYGTRQSGYAEVRAAVVRARRAYRGRLLIAGESAGGHLAMLVAARHPGLVDGTLALGAPSTVKAWTEDPRPRPQALASYFRTVFGPSTARWEPLHQYRLLGVRDPVVLAVAQGDPLIGPGHLQTMTTLNARRGNRKVTTVRPEPGGEPFVHTGITPAAWARLLRVIDRRLL